MNENENSSMLKQDITVNDIKYYFKQIQHTISMLNKAIDDCVDKIDSITKKLTTEVENLQEEGFILQKLPDSIKDHLAEILPMISKQLMINIFHDLDKTTQGISKNIQIVEAKLVKSSENAEEKIAKLCEQANTKLNEAINTSLSFDKFLFKKILINVLIVVLVSTVCATGISYLMIKKYPQHIELKTDKSITVHDSDVTFWGAKNPQVINNTKSRIKE